jgi:hypothetical protein
MYVTTTQHNTDYTDEKSLFIYRSRSTNKIKSNNVNYLQNNLYTTDLFTYDHVYIKIKQPNSNSFVILLIIYKMR